MDLDHQTTSMTEMTMPMEESLMRAMNSLPSVGSTILNAWGRMMKSIDWLYDRPSDLAASIWPL